MPVQTDLFAPALPQGFVYEPEFLSPADEARLIGEAEGLAFKPFEFRGFLGKREVVSFGWKYDYNDRSFRSVTAIPDWLLPVREQAAGFAGLAPEALEQALVTRYEAGTSIGWHRDRPVFEDVVGISLTSPCTFRFRRKVGDQWERRSLAAEPRSIYLLRGPSRHEWEHSIPAVDALRYSVTFRALA